MLNNNSIAAQTLTGNANIKTTTNATVNSFLLLDKLDTSSKGPECLTIVIKIITNAIIKKRSKMKKLKASSVPESPN